MKNILSGTAAQMRRVINALPSWSNTGDKNVIRNLVIPAGVGMVGLGFAGATGHLPFVSTIDGGAATKDIAMCLGAYYGIAAGGAVGVTVASVGHMIKSLFGSEQELNENFVQTNRQKEKDIEAQKDIRSFNGGWAH